MLQDLEANRPMEIDPLLTVVQEMGRLVGEATPTIDTVLALIKLRGQIAEQSYRPVEKSAPVVETA
jgi:2-dehydropantoate 2-reductase